MNQSKVLVYVQAVPIGIPTSAKRLQDISDGKFRISHSSRAALALATSLGAKEIVAAGHGPVLPEAVARGASSSVPLPLFDDPLKQAQSFPDDTFSQIVIGENDDWLFSGASLAGILARSRGLKIALHDSGHQQQFSEGSVIVVRDEGESTPSIDIRRIRDAVTASAGPSQVYGRIVFSKLEEPKTELVVGSPREISSAVKRKLRRLVA